MKKHTKQNKARKDTTGGHESDLEIEVEPAKGSDAAKATPGRDGDATHEAPTPAPGTSPAAQGDSGSDPKPNNKTDSNETGPAAEKSRVTYRKRSDEGAAQWRPTGSSQPITASSPTGNGSANGHGNGKGNGYETNGDGGGLEAALASDVPTNGQTRTPQQSKRLRRYSEVLARYVERQGLDAERPPLEIPTLPPSAVSVEERPVADGLAHIRVVYDEARREHVYEAIEPLLTDDEQQALEFLRETLYRTLQGRHDVSDRYDWRQHLDAVIDELIVDHFILIDQVSCARVKYWLFREFLGYGPVDVLMADPMIEDISCDGPDIPVYVFHRRYESIRTNIRLRTDDQLDAFVVRLGQLAGKHISLADPLLDATLPDSSRLQATLSREITTRGSSFTIRRFRADPLTPPDLIRVGTMDAKMAAFFWLAMEGGNSLIYAGGTASGKTTTLNAVCQFIPPEKKIVSIEDTREINLRHENWIAGVSRGGAAARAGDASGNIDMYRLLEAALRQRPEYLLVGEVRGVEAKTLFQAMATGHATYSTLHADSARSAVYRLENRPIDIPRIMLQTLDAFAVQVQARLGDRLVRRLKEVVEVVGIHPDSGDLVMNTVFRWRSSDDSYEFMGSSNILREIMESRNISSAEFEHEWQRRERLLARMADAGIRHIDDVSEIIRRYYREPSLAEAWVDLLVDGQEKRTQEQGPLATVRETGGRR